MILSSLVVLSSLFEPLEGGGGNVCHVAAGLGGLVLGALLSPEQVAIEVAASFLAAERARQPPHLVQQSQSLQWGCQRSPSSKR